jgi:hypothetical protein
MRTIRPWHPGENHGAALYTSLWASAMCNMAKPPSHGRRRWKLPQYRITERIQNCVIIATHLQSESKDSSVQSQAQPNVIRQRLCTAASTSTYCYEYVYMPSCYTQYFRTYAEGDAYLETALLVACGYSSKAVVSTMVNLVKNGKLGPYIACDIRGHVKSGRRWREDGLPSCGGFYISEIELRKCGRCGKTFETGANGRQYTLQDFY